MELGTGVFLSAVLLGTVALFIATKDRWNWKKILLWPVGIILALSVIGGIVGYVYTQYEEQPRKLTSLWDIPLGASIADVKFMKGLPGHQYDGDTWIYRARSYADDSNYIVRFRDGRVRIVAYQGPKYNGPHINGFDQYSTPETVEKKLGPPSNVSYSEDGLKRLYSFERYNIMVEFARNEVIFYGVYDSGTGPIEYKKSSAKGEFVPDAPTTGRFDPDAYLKQKGVADPLTKKQK